jgi:hypothetical protein
MAGLDVEFTTRIPVYWGHYSQVEATLILMRDALKRGPYSHMVLLSRTH